MVRVSLVLVASVAGSADFARDDVTSMLQVKVSAHNQDQVCVHAIKGDVAPSEGLFNGRQVEIGEVAQESGRFCVKKDVYALVQRSFARSSTQDVDMALARKGATVAPTVAPTVAATATQAVAPTVAPIIEKSVSGKGQTTQDAPSTETSVSNKNAGNQRKATSPTPTSCQFSNEPVQKYFWDPACKDGGLGCKADGKSDMCRFCGGDTYVPCPTETIDSCQFSTEPVTKYFWDPACKDGGLGCKADGKSDMCRFCGGDTYVPCPTETIDSCQFSNEPVTKYFWDPACKDGGLGCKADGKSDMCRFCGGDTYVPCPTNLTTPSP